MALNGIGKEDIVRSAPYIPAEPKVLDLARGNYLGKTYEQLTGSGYVIESLESALWCFYHTEDFEEAILAAANLGNDADTTAAICGQIAGAYYGSDDIPGNWLENLVMRKEIEQMAGELYYRGKMIERE